MARACFGNMSWMHRICFSCCLEAKRNQLSLLGLLPAVPTAIPKESRRTTRMDPTARATIRARQTARLVTTDLEPILEPLFHPDSFGYRPGKSAIDAVRQSS